MCLQKSDHNIRPIFGQNVRKPCDTFSKKVFKNRLDIKNCRVKKRVDFEIIWIKFDQNSIDFNEMENSAKKIP